MEGYSIVYCKEGVYKVICSMQRFQAGDQVLKEEWLLSTHARKSQLISVYVHGHGIYMYVLSCENSHCLNWSNNPQTGLLSGF